MKKFIALICGVVLLSMLFACACGSSNSKIESNAKPVVTQILSQNDLLRSTFGNECKSVKITDKVSDNTYNAIAECENGTIGSVMKIKIELAPAGKQILVSPMLFGWG